MTSMPLELVHSDVCGKMGRKSMGGAEYFLTLLYDKTHYAWVYPLKTKGQAFEHFKEWQAEVENLTGQRVKTLRTDNGGEFTSKSFQAHLKEFSSSPQSLLHSARADDSQDSGTEWSS